MLEGRSQAASGPADLRRKRLINPITNKYLHMSGSGETKNETYAWLGYAYQAEVLLNRARVRNDDFPYEFVERQDLQVKPNA
jgi:hypothetical protein